VAEPLATYADLVNRLGCVIDQNRAEALLRDASAAVRRAAGGQIISRVLNDTALIRPCGTSLWLPQYPVLAVDSIVDSDATAVEFTWELGQDVAVFSTAHGHSFERDFLFPPSPLTVVYDHGYEPVPDDIIAVVCQVAGRAYGTNPQTTGLTQESLGAYSYSIGSAAASGPLGLLPGELAICRAYRRPGRPISVLT
jgi:hypothetical protein